MLQIISYLIIFAFENTNIRTFVQEPITTFKSSNTIKIYLKMQIEVFYFAILFHFWIKKIKFKIFDCYAKRCWNIAMKHFFKIRSMLFFGCCFDLIWVLFNLSIFIFNFNFDFTNLMLFFLNNYHLILNAIDFLSPSLQAETLWSAIKWKFYFISFVSSSIFI